MNSFSNSMACRRTLPWTAARKELPDHKAVVTLLPEPAKEVTIRLGAAAGAWKTLVGRTPQAGASSSYHLGNRDCTAIFLDPVETEGETRTAVSFNRVPGWANRVIAPDTNGQVHVSFPHGLSVDEMATAEGRFAGLPLKQVKEFRFQTRPYNYVQFRHVSLAPGEPTHVEIMD